MADRRGADSTGQWLRQARGTAGLTQTDLSRITGISERTIRELEQDRATPRPATIDRLTAALGATRSQPLPRTRIQVLGPVQVSTDDVPQPIRSGRRRCLLAYLALHANHPVSVAELLDTVWSDRPNPARSLLHSQVSRLRSQLGAGPRIDRVGDAYRLVADDDEIDLLRFHEHATHADQASGAGALREWEAALALRRGPVAQDVAALTGHPVVATVTSGLNRGLLRYAELALTAGEPRDTVQPLRHLLDTDPLDEEACAWLIRALAATGQQAAALDVFSQMRRRLAADLGIDPSTELRAAHEAVLNKPHADPSRVVPSQLPGDVRHFTGRHQELAALTDLVPGGTVVISGIGGPGGIGKTALALRWAHQHLDQFPDGQMYVNLRGFDPAGPPTTPGEALRAFLDALGVDPATLPLGVAAQAGRYRSLVTGKRMLIMLDNARDVEQVLPLLPGSPTCTVLVTSRQHLTGLAALHGAHLLDLDVLPEPDAHDLLARLLGADRVAAEPDAVAELLAVCAGLPLAVRIVAARAAHHPSFPLALLADELRDGSARLDGLDAGDLHTNLRAVLSSSIRTLSASAADLFGLLGIAPGPDISLPAAASLIALSEGQTREALQELEHASLVQQHTPGRYRMHDLIRLYATDTAQHDMSALMRLLDFYLHTAYAADRLLAPDRLPVELDPPAPGTHPQPIADIPAALDWFTAEHSALLAAQRTSASHARHLAVWQLARTLDTFHYRQGHVHDQLAAWQAVLDAATHFPDPTASMIAHRTLGYTYTDLGRYEEAIGHLHQALALAEQHHDPGQQAHAHRGLAAAWDKPGEERQALHHATRAWRLYCAIDQPVGKAAALNLMGWYAARLGEYDTARSHCQEAIALLRDHPYPEFEATTLDSLGYIAHHAGDHEQSIYHYQQAITLRRDLGNTYEAANTLDNLGHPHLALGEHEQAREVWREALRLYQEQGRDADAERVRQQLAQCQARISNCR